MNIKETYCILLLVFACLITKGQQKVDFQLNLSKTPCFIQTTSIHSQTENVVQGKKTTISNSSRTEKKYTVVNSTHDMAVLNIMHTDFEIEMKNGNISQKSSPQSYDSLNIYNPATQQMEILNKSFSAWINNKGKVVKLKNTENLLSSLQPKIKKMSKTMRKDYLKMYQNYVSDEMLKVEIEMLTNFYPDSVVQTGDKWTGKSQIMSMLAETVFELKHQTDTTCIIEGTGELYSDSTKTTEAMGIMMKTNTMGIREVSITVDKQTFLPLEYVIMDTVAGDIMMLDKQGNEIMRSPMEQTQTTIITLKFCKHE